MTSDEVLNLLKKNGNQKNREGMARFGINAQNAFGISMPVLRSLGKTIGTDHKLALELWKTGFHEARILCTLIADPAKATPALMDRWVKDFNSWDVCDQCCLNFFFKTEFALDKIKEWNDSSDEFVKRASFALIAVCAVHRKDWNDSVFLSFFPLIEKHSTDERNFVKKAVNWALRQIGKRNRFLNGKASELCLKIAKIDSKTAKWIASDALKELTNSKIQSRLKS
jgi:3-methyladenine DNA glycosylase AlkD